MRPPRGPLIRIIFLPSLSLLQPNKSVLDYKQSSEQKEETELSKSSSNTERFIMKLLIAFAAIITIVSAGDSNDFYDVDGPLAKQDVLKFTNGYFHSDDPNSWTAYVRRVAARLRRAANDDFMKTSVERMEMISSLTNTIFLQQGLIDGSINSSDLISELLHFGSVTPAKIHEIDETKMNEALTKLKELPSKLKTTTAITALETCFDNVNTVLKEVEGIDDVTIWQNEDAYKQDIDTLATGNHTGFSLISGLKDTLGEWKTYHLNAMKQMNKVDFTTTDQTWIIKLGDASTAIINAEKSLSANIPKLYEFENAMSASQSVRYLDQLVKAVKKINDIKFAKPSNGFTELQTNLNVINTVILSIQEVQSHLDDIINLFASRSSPEGIKSSVLTVGLPQGFNDISRMLTQFNDPWFLEVVRDKRMKESFKSIKTLESGVTVLDKTLGYRAESEQKLDKIKSVVRITNTLVRSFSSYSLNSSKEINKCIMNPSTSSDSSNIEKLVELATNIDEELNNLQNQLKKFQEKISGKVFSENLQNLAKLCDTGRGDTVESWKTAYTSLSNFKELNDLDKFVGEVLENANDIKDSKLKSLATSSQPLFASLKTYLSEITEHTDLLNCLIKINDTRPTINVIHESKNLRDSQTHIATVENAADVVTKLVGTKKDLNTLETTIKSIKGSKSVESDLLNLPDAEKHSQVLGTSTQGVVRMKKAIDTKSTADVIKRNADIVKSEVSQAKGLSTEDNGNLTRLESLGNSWDEMIAQLNTWKNGIKKLNSSTLADYADIFLEAKKVNGIDDLKKISSSLSHLIDLVPGSSNKKQLEDIKKAVDELDEIGLQFAGYQKSFDESKKSLAALDLFFADFDKKISVTVAPPITPQQQQPQVSLSTTVESVEPVRHDLIFQKNIWQVILITIAGFFSSLMAAPLVTVLMIRLRSCLLRRKFKKRGFRIRRRRRGRKVCGQKTVIVTWEQAVRHMREFKDKLSYWGQANPCTRGLNESDDDYNLRSNLFRRWSEHTFRQISFDYKENIQAGDVNTLSDFVMKHKDEWRKAVELNKNTNVILPTSKPGEGGVRFKTSFIHASRVRLEPNRQLILTQGPQIESKGKKSTMEKFWYLVKSEKARAVVMLCDFIEGDERKCDVYLPLKVGEVVQHGVYSIKCTRVVVNGSVTNRHLVLSQGKKNHGLSHFQYLGWPDKGVPKDCKELLNFWKIVRNMNTNTIIHCSAGIGRSGTLAYIEKLYQAIYNSPKAAHQSLLTALRGERARSVQSESQFAFAIYSVFKLMFMKLERKKTKKAPNTMNKSVDKTKKSVEGTNKKSVDRKKKKVEKIPQEKPKEIAEVKEFLKSLEDDWKVILKVCAGGKELAKKEKNLKIEGDLVEALRKKDAKEKSEAARKEKEINGGKGEKVKVDKKATGDKNVQKKGDKGKQVVKAKSKEMGQKDVKEKEQEKKDVKGKSKEQAKKAGK
ncbi:hypothetical protein CRE_08732 [Caenorhabditis remanei]|uniref:Tyrosine-protein phosphatase domain-containing protein n=1 Tax=Caenorhabditis remanei TaxID=31234 RepID=E3LJM0_CAERE|nr:hypothetical protein CRE_08732 [Caenorhabditis remanei]